MCPYARRALAMWMYGGVSLYVSLSLHMQRASKGMLDQATRGEKKMKVLISLL